VPLHNEAGSNRELAARVKSILATKQLTLHQASQASATLFGRGSPYYLPHNLYYDLSHAHFSPSLFQLVAFSRISNYRLRDWLRVFGFDIEAIPRQQIQLGSKRTVLLESSLDDPSFRIRWFRNLHTSAPPAEIVPLAHLLEWGEPRRLASLAEFHDGGFLYAQIGSEDAFAFPELLPDSIVRVNPKLTGEALKQVTAERSADLFLIRHGRGLNCCHVRVSGRGRIGTISTQLPYARMDFRVPDEARILGVADIEIRHLVAPRQPSVVKSLAKRWNPDLLSANPSQLGSLLRRARIEMGLSFRAAAAKSRELADALGDERYFTASGSLSDYETLNTPPRHFHKVITFCVIYSLPLNQIFQVLGLSLEQAGHEPIPELLTGGSASGIVDFSEAEGNEETGFISALADLAIRTLVDCTSHQFFAGSSLACDEHGGIGWRHFPHQHQNAPNCRGGTDDLLERRCSADLLFQREVLFVKLILQRLDFVKSFLQSCSRLVLFFDINTGAVPLNDVACLIA
jgi:hypothetical protein